MISDDVELILEDDTYWLYKFDEFTLHVPKCYEKIKGFDREYIFQNNELNTKELRLTFIDLKEYSTYKWSWINEHCIVRGKDLYYTPKKIPLNSNIETQENKKKIWWRCCFC